MEKIVEPRQPLLWLSCWQPNVVYFTVGAGLEEALSRWIVDYDWTALAPYLALAVGVGIALRPEWPAWP